MLSYKGSQHLMGALIMSIGLQSLLSGQYLVGAVQVTYCIWLSKGI